MLQLLNAADDDDTALMEDEEGGAATAEGPPANQQALAGTVPLKSAWRLFKVRLAGLCRREGGWPKRSGVLHSSSP